MSDEDYVRALVNGHATIEHRSERVLVDEVKRLRSVESRFATYVKMTEAEIERLRKQVEETAKAAGVERDQNERLQAVVADQALTIDVLKDDSARKTAAVEGSQKQLERDVIDLRTLRAENAVLRQAAEDANELGHELDWYRRFWEWASDHVIENGEGEMCTAIQAYEIDNPKPGAGT